MKVSGSSYCTRKPDMSSTATEILFLPDGSVELLPRSSVTGFPATVQRALVNCLEIQGADPIFPRRGTDLLARALGGSLLNLRAAEHAGNFAASDTLFFGREYDITDSQFKLAEMQLSVAVLSLAVLELQASFVSIGGVTTSFAITNSPPA
jgi:hypothetical protein